MDARKDVRVLIVEDEPLVGEMIRGVIESRNYQVAGIAITGSQAIEMTQTIRPDVILMDIELPDMPGIEATQRIAESCPTPVVVLTAYDNPELIEEASAAGVGAYLIKPPNPGEVDRAITIATARFDDLMELRRLNAELQAALAQVRTLRGLLPICSNCKKIRDDEGYWTEVEIYIHEHSAAEFTHGICPDCVKKLYPDYYERIEGLI